MVSLLTEQVADDSSEPKLKKVRLDPDLTSNWVKFGNITLTVGDKHAIVDGKRLHDNYINISQAILSKQFPEYCGFRNTLKQQLEDGWKDNYIFFCRGNHWIAASTVGNNHGEVTISDSLYNNVDKITNSKICEVFQLPTIKYKFLSGQVQEGYDDCGLFAVAFATHIAFTSSVNDMPHFDQSKLRSQLMDY